MHVRLQHQPQAEPPSRQDQPVGVEPLAHRIDQGRLVTDRQEVALAVGVVQLLDPHGHDPSYYPEGDTSQSGTAVRDAPRGQEPQTRSRRSEKAARAAGRRVVRMGGSMA